MVKPNAGCGKAGGSFLADKWRAVCEGEEKGANALNDEWWEVEA
jgi:hypothetical protein